MAHLLLLVGGGSGVAGRIILALAATIESAYCRKTNPLTRRGSGCEAENFGYLGHRVTARCWRAHSSASPRVSHTPSVAPFLQRTPPVRFVSVMWSLGSEKSHIKAPRLVAENPCSGNKPADAVPLTVLE